MSYREFRYFCAFRDSEVVRLSLADPDGQEYFAIIEAAEGKRWRETREAALMAIDDAIAAGDPPGEIDVRSAGVV